MLPAFRWDPATAASASREEAALRLKWMMTLLNRQSAAALDALLAARRAYTAMLGITAWREAAPAYAVVWLCYHYTLVVAPL